VLYQWHNEADTADTRTYVSVAEVLANNLDKVDVHIYQNVPIDVSHHSNTPCPLTTFDVDLPFAPTRGSCHYYGDRYTQMDLMKADVLCNVSFGQGSKLRNKIGILRLLRKHVQPKHELECKFFMSIGSKKRRVKVRCSAFSKGGEFEVRD
jgi:hypothetical protein